MLFKDTNKKFFILSQSFFLNFSTKRKKSIYRHKFLLPLLQSLSSLSSSPHSSLPLFSYSFGCETSKSSSLLQQSFFFNSSKTMASQSHHPHSHPSPPRQMNLIVAVDGENGISKDNSLPWHLPKEYKHFQQTTIKTMNPNKINAVIMGRKCWDSIPAKFRPLKDRINVILSKTLPSQTSEHCIITDDFDKALIMLTEEEPYKSKVETIWNVGGNAIYKMGLEHPWMHKLVITKIEATFDTDVKFPEVDWENYERNDDFDENPIEEKGFKYTIHSYTKK